MTAMTSVTLSPGRCPPIPGLVPWPILISIASQCSRVRSLKLYWLGMYSKMYLWAAAISSQSAPPSPLHIAVPAMALPLDSAIFALPDNAPKLMWLMYTGISSSIGLRDPFPMTVRMDTSSHLSFGALASCAPRNRMSSKPGTSSSVSMALSTLLPVMDIAWMSSMTPPSYLIRFCGSEMSMPSCSATTSAGPAGTACG